MAVYWSFPILKEQSDSTVVFDKDVDVSTLVLQKDGADVSPAATFVNNGDGTYRVAIDGYGSGRYSVKLNGVVQDELGDVYKVTDDNITTQNLVGTAAKGYIRQDGSGDLYVYTDGSNAILHGGDIIDDLTSGGTTKALSAEQGKTLKTLVDGKEPADSTILKEADILSDITTGGTTKVVSADAIKDELVPGFANPSFVSNNNTTVQNLDALDKAVAAVSAGTGANKYRHIVGESTIAANGTTDAAALGTWTIPAGSNLNLFHVPFMRKAGESTLYIAVNIKEDTSDATYDVGFDKDGTTVNYDSAVDLTTSYATKIHSFDISTFTVDTLYDLTIWFSAQTNNVSIQKPVVLVK